MSAPIDPALTSDDAIEALIRAFAGPTSTEMHRTLYREALRGLVRLAQAEQLSRMQADFERLTHPEMALPRKSGQQQRLVTISRRQFPTGD